MYFNVFNSYIYTCIYRRYSKIVVIPTRIASLLGNVNHYSQYFFYMCKLNLVYIHTLFCDRNFKNITYHVEAYRCRLQLIEIPKETHVLYIYLKKYHTNSLFVQKAEMRNWYTYTDYSVIATVKT